NFSSPLHEVRLSRNARLPELNSGAQNRDSAHARHRANRSRWGGRTRPCPGRRTRPVQSETVGAEEAVRGRKIVTLLAGSERGAARGQERSAQAPRSMRAVP